MKKPTILWKKYRVLMIKWAVGLRGDTAVINWTERTLIVPIGKRQFSPMIFGFILRHCNYLDYGGWNGIG